MLMKSRYSSVGIVKVLPPFDILHRLFRKSLSAFHVVSADNRTNGVTSDSVFAKASISRRNASSAFGTLGCTISFSDGGRSWGNGAAPRPAEPFALFCGPRFCTGVFVFFSAICPPDQF